MEQLQKLAGIKAELLDRVEWHMLEEFISTVPTANKEELCAPLIDALFAGSWGEMLHEFIVEAFPTEEEQAQMEQEDADDLAYLQREWAATRLKWGIT